MTTLITFLGAIPYSETRYYLGTPDAARPPTPYVQEAVLAHLAENGQKVDNILVFTTKDAAANNYRNRIVKFNTESGTPTFEDHGKGLGARLEDMRRSGQIGHYEAVPIPEGNSEAEILKVFAVLYEKLSKLPPRTKVYFDITYGFRSLPMLCIVLLNYVRTLHNIRVEGIFYGNYEVGRHEQQQTEIAMRAAGASEGEIKQFKSQPTFSPVLNLRAFADLQEWTAAARIFLEGGNAHALADLMPPDKQHVGQAFRAFTDEILTCRGLRISMRDDLEQMKFVIRDLQRELSIEAQLSPILEKIEQKIAGFTNKTTLNGFAAVEWCIQHKLLQQGFTFLEETCKSFLIEQTHHIEDINNPLLRESARTVLNQIPRHRWTLKENKQKNDKIDHDATILMKEYAGIYFPELPGAYGRLTGGKGLRNDMNHCGHQQQPNSPKKLEAELRSIYEAIKTALSL